MTSKSGGAGSSESRTTAEYRRAEYGAAAGPAVFDVEVLNGGGFALRARPVAVDDGGPRVFVNLPGAIYLSKMITTLVLVLVEEATLVLVGR